MDITPLSPKGSKIINSYGDGGFTINGERYAHDVIIAAGQVFKWNLPIMQPEEPVVFAESDFAALFALPEMPEILLIGTGRKLHPVSAALRAAFRARGIALDAMDTGAACRTFNVLLNEGRDVAAAMVAV
jgi:uncharacterized protein